ncbi:MAG: cytochrome P450 [Polyangiales bacterium]
MIGNLLELRRDPAALLRRVLAECGDVGAFTIGPRAVTVIASAELARQVLVDDADAYEKGPVVRTFSRPILGDGLISIDNARHREHRRIVAPAFGPKALAGYAKVMAEVAEETVSSWEDGATIDVGEEMTRLALRVVGRTLFSVDLGREQPELSEAIATVQRWVTAQIKRPFPFPLTPSVRAAIARLDAAIARLIAERRRGGPDDLLAALVHTELGDRQIRDEAMTLFLAGHETSAGAMTWAIDLLMRHPDAWALPFEHVFSETLRLYPSVHSLGRQASRSVRLGSFELPRGAIVIVSPFLMHRREAYFPRPDLFDPSRFAAPTFPKFSYLPFGAGPRACLGGQFATMEATTMLSAIARSVRLEPLDPSPNDVEMLVTLRPKREIRAKVTRQG